MVARGCPATHLCTLVELTSQDDERETVAPPVASQCRFLTIRTVHLRQRGLTALTKPPPDPKAIRSRGTPVTPRASRSRIWPPGVPARSRGVRYPYQCRQSVIVGGRDSTSVLCGFSWSGHFSSSKRSLGQCFQSTCLLFGALRATLPPPTPAAFRPTPGKCTNHREGTPARCRRRRARQTAAPSRHQPGDMRGSHSHAMTPSR